MEEAVLKGAAPAAGTAGVDEPRRETATASHHIDWGRIKETYVRCCFLLGVMLLLGFMAWRPGMLRLATILSLTRPSHGESLAWRPDDDFAPPLPRAVRVQPPSEWRQSPETLAAVTPTRPDLREIALTRGRMAAPAWSRLFMNPWTWQNDVSQTRARERGDIPQPDQQPATAYRVGNLAAWPGTVMPPTVTEAVQSPAAVIAAVTPPAAKSSESASLALPPLPSALPPFPAFAAPKDDKANEFDALALPELPGIAPIRDAKEKPASAAPAALRPTLEPKRLELPAPLDRQEPPASQKSAVSPAAAKPAATEMPVAAKPAPEMPTVEKPAPAKKEEAPESVDWANREITQAIPGAYLTIYPKLKFVGLCVPGQGYVRKYNQVGVPADLSQPKASAEDGKTPYGKYYVAARKLDAGGESVLTLSWPSPEDAKRIGLSPEKVTEVEAAWEKRDLPPQNTEAGGGLTLAGSKNPGEFTKGGFVITDAQMQELVTALPDDAWVFVQQ